MNEAQLDAHKSLSELPEMTHLPQNTEELVGMEIVNNNNKYSSSSSSIFLSAMLENTQLDSPCTLNKSQVKKE